MRKENETTASNMDFSSASATIGGLESFLEEGVSYDSADNKAKPQEPKKNAVDISSFLDESTDDSLIPKEEGDDTETVEPKLDDSEKKEPLKEETKKEPKLGGTGFDYKSVIQSLVENKIFEGFDTFETEEGDIAFEDYDIDADTFIDIVKAKMEEAKEQGSTNTTKGLSDFTKHLLEIEKNGGNVSQALETYQTYQDPLDSFDLTNEVDQQRAIFMKYHRVMGMEKDVVMDLIDGFMTKGKLEDEAIKADTEIRGAVQKQMDAINQQAIKEKESKKDSLKAYKSALRENLNKFDLNENYKRKILDAATKETDSGAFELDSLYYSVRNNPEKAAALVLFLSDPEEYKKQISKADVRDTQLDTFKKFKLVKKGNDNIKITNKDKPAENRSKDLIDLKDIFQ